MRKEDYTIPAIFFEAITLLLAIMYMGLQVYYGFVYRVAPSKFIFNLLTMALIYALLTMLCVYPEKINRLPAELCVGKVRVFSLRMIRIIKFIFVAGLLIPCIFDALGTSIQGAYSLIIMGLILVTALFYEWKIFQELKKNQ